MPIAGALSDAELGKASERASDFDLKEMDKVIRQIVDKVRGQYFLNGETARGILGEVKKIIDQNVNRI